MAKLKAATRNKLPGSVFGRPKQRKYPMEDRAHQIKAEEFATKEEHAGKTLTGPGGADQGEGQAAPREVYEIEYREYEYRFSVSPYVVRPAGNRRSAQHPRRLRDPTAG